MKALLIPLTVLTLLIGPVTLGADEKTDKKASVWMQKKLEYSQNILAGLTKGDFDAIGKNATAMGFMGFLEKWMRSDMPAYKQQMTHFDWANKEIYRQAEAKNLEGVTLAYNQLTVSCVQCHKIVRDVQKK
jgi:hypothetical protein